MKKYLFYVGVDVSKLKLDVNVLNVSSLKSEHFIIENDIKSITTFIKNLNKKIGINQTLFCCENTGVYTNHLSSVSADLKLDLWIVPAIEIKRSKGISRGKTDKSDAKDIAYYSYRNIDKLKLFTLTDTDIQRLKILYTERGKMLKSLLLLETTKENKDFASKEVFKEVSAINQGLTKTIKNAIRKIESKIKEIIKENAQLNKQIQLIRTIPGIGEQTSIYLIIATKGFTAFKN